MSWPKLLWKLNFRFLYLKSFYELFPCFQDFSLLSDSKLKAEPQKRKKYKTQSRVVLNLVWNPEGGEIIPSPEFFSSVPFGSRLAQDLDVLQVTVCWKYKKVLQALIMMTIDSCIKESTKHLSDSYIDRAKTLPRRKQWGQGSRSTPTQSGKMWIQLCCWF